MISQQSFIHLQARGVLKSLEPLTIRPPRAHSHQLERVHDGTDGDGGDISRCIFCLKDLSADDISKAIRHKKDNAGDRLFGPTSDVGWEKCPDD